jgi:hypothetical protein
MWSTLDLYLIYIKKRDAALRYHGGMPRIAHTLSCLLLAFALILSGPGGSGPAKGALLVELCADKAVSLVWIDDDGNPITLGQEHGKCLDCLIFSAPLPRPADGLVARNPLPVAPGLSLPVSSPPQTVAYLRPTPRGPPTAEGAMFRLGSLPRDSRFSLPSAVDLLALYQAKSMAGPTDLQAIL